MILRRKSDHKAHQPINFLIARAESDPEGLLFDNGSIAATNKSALDLTRQIARYFDELGVKPGDIVGLNMPPVLYIYFLMATWHHNAIATNYTQRVALNNDWKPEWIFSTVDFDSQHGKKVILVTQEILDRIKTLEPLTDAQPYDSLDDPIALVFSSGTTGLPKAFQLSIANLEARVPIYLDPSYGYSRSLVMLDIATATGLGSFYGEMRTNNFYRIPGDMQANVKLVSKHQVRSMIGSPNQFTEFLKVAQDSPTADIQVETCLVTGSMLSRATAAQIKDYLKCKIYNLYGSSEVGLVSIRRDDSVNPFDLGFAIPDLQVEIVDEAGQKVAAGVTGRIRTKSKSFASGYFRDPENSKKFFKDGWFFSGDLGHFDEDNRLFLDGRNSELVNAGGVKVDPAKIDEFVIGKFGVGDAGTFGYIDSTGAERIGIALVVAGEFQEKVLVEGIHQFSGTGFPIDTFQVDHIIRNDRGKVSRREIAASYLEFIGAKN